VRHATPSDATSGPDLGEAEQEVTLHAEQPVAAKETVPVRMDTETVTEQAQVDDTVRKEQIDGEGDDTAGRRGHRRRTPTETTET
jgi:hypothetical protein